ncbi:MAG: RNA helicase [Chloroflexi bacterium HGW-Chloroflexi-4]|jgi:ATP-dependent RNA helicase DeaD|nr:MAG: RNA helicase [Chloroflexi bacterium HGW-Chloroflexi-4]
MVSPFESLGLQPEFVQAVEKMGFIDPTPIQSSAIPLLLEGRDVIGQAQTGTGKTAAFMLPLLQKLEPSTGKVQALVLAPTRELAKQVADAALLLAQKTRVKVLAVYGGQSYTIQTRALDRGVDVVVGTPGRLLDLIKQKVLGLHNVKMLILDEADEMLAMGFIDDVELILKELNEEKQIALFSATLPQAIQKLANRYLKEPARISVSPERMTVADTEQRYCRIHEENKLSALTRLLETEDVSSGLIFARTKARAQELADQLIQMGFPSDSLHGDLNQARREQVLNKFRQGQISLMVATDVAARGLDIAGVSHVFNYDVPADAEDYVHRIGRTGRAGKKGIAVTFLTPKERGRLNQIQAYTKQPMIEFSLPSVDAVKARREDRLITRISEQLLAGVTPAERELVGRMNELGLSPVEIAVAAIRLVRAGEGTISTKEIQEPAQESKYKRLDERRAGNDRQREKWNSKTSTGTSGAGSYQKKPASSGSKESGMVRLWMNLGNANGIRPGDVVGAIASESGIPGRAIGEIDIRSDHTFVDVAEQHVKMVLKASEGKYRLRGKPVLLRLAD